VRQTGPLVAEAVDDPEEEAEENTEQDAGREGEGDGPVAAAPGEVSGETAERKMEARKAEDEKAGDDEGETEEDEDAAEVGHGLRQLGGSQHGGSFAEKLRRLAGLGEDAYGARQFVRLLTDVLEVGVERRKDDDAARRKLLGDIANKGQAVASWHGNVAEQEMGRVFASTLQRFIGGVYGPGVEATLHEDESERVSDQTIIVDDKNSLHWHSPFMTFAIE
jgi:hypothetical protein